APEADGTYKIPEGASVVVTFSRNGSAFIDRSTMVFKMDGDMALPENGRPQAVSPSALLSINEIMASNGNTLKTVNGKSGLDWIEIRNKADYDIDIAGWYLSDNPDKASSKWKTVKGSAIVPAKGYKVVWADKDYNDFADVEAYTEIGLSSSGETVFLATPEGDVVHSVSFGVAVKDVSVGAGTRYKTVVGRNDAAEWRVAGAGEWVSCKGPLAATNTASAGFTVVSRTSSLDAPTTNVCATIVSAIGAQGENAELSAFGTVLIPRAGKWTFKCGGRGESVVTFSRGGVDWTLENTWAVFSFPEAGAYDVTLQCKAADGTAAPELLFMEGEPPESEEGAGAEPNVDSLELTPVGEGAIAHAAPFAAQFAAGTDVSDAVRETGAFEWRTAFTLDAAPGENAQLRICYADGFSASINGYPFASVAANGPRAKSDAVRYETFAVPAAYLTSGYNTLLISVQDDIGGDREMFFAAELVLPAAEGEDKVYYFLRPTPGAANGADAKDGPTPKVSFSVPHGYKTEPFMLELSCAEAPDAAIYYTLDGTSPDASKTLYTGPIEISRTTVVRAAVPNANAVLQYDTSATYLFVEDILVQKNGPAGFPSGTDTGYNQSSTAVNGQNLKYGMRSDVVAKYRTNILNGFTNGIDTVSLVVDPSGLFDPSTGIYVNAMNDGRSWERHVVFEMFSATNASAAGITVPAGLRIRGGMSRQGRCRKHALRLFFRSDYGENKLEYKLFGDEGVGTFDKIDLRTAQNHSWELGGSRDFTLIEDVFSRDSQRDMGQSYHRSRYYHLFINGAYWGLYQTEERTDGHFGEYYFGGDDEDWDVVRTSHSSGVIDYKTGIVDGDKTAWTNFWDITVNQGYSGAYASNYNKVMGLNPDGTRNPDYPIYLNPTNLAVYMLTVHFTNDQDCPAYRLHPNNIAMLRNRYDGTKSFNGINGA
ncbi:MAG: lamin tail domain-containing protein, partial [Kiritimatiellae bacterium]|nr:lamin tail domain-containing protein [Kiritimatiellia bacterium]